MKVPFNPGGKGAMDVCRPDSLLPELRDAWAKYFSLWHSAMAQQLSGKTFWGFSAQNEPLAHGHSESPTSYLEIPLLYAHVRVIVRVIGCNVSDGDTPSWVRVVIRSVGLLRLHAVELHQVCHRPPHARDETGPP